MITAAVEGLADEVVVNRLIEDVAGSLGTVYGKRGKSHLVSRLVAYNHAAQYSPWLILVDLDTDADCGPSFRFRLLPNPASLLCFTVVVRAMEAWLLSDREHLARFLSVNVADIPLYPETLDNPKRAMVEIASRSRRRDIREDMVPRRGSGRTVGPAYASRLIEFVSHDRYAWRPDIAAPYSPSLARTIRCIGRLIQRTGER